jgi:hypothetical protein
VLWIITIFVDWVLAIPSHSSSNSTAQVTRSIAGQRDGELIVGPVAAFGNDTSTQVKKGAKIHDIREVKAGGVLIGIAAATKSGANVDFAEGVVITVDPLKEKEAKTSTSISSSTSTGGRRRR